MKAEDRQGGKLKIFFGMAPGVGKTYALLQEAHQHLKEGMNVVVGNVNTHGRQELEKLLEGLPLIPEKWVEFKDKAFKELDVAKILETKPQLVLIDELAHSNVPGSKHPKRWQDIVEILDAGIDVYTTLNVQHLESRKEIVEGITGVPVQETVPDLILERATAIEIIDISPDELLERLKEGKVYLGDQSLGNAQKFFREEPLTALREIALRFTAEKVDHDLHGILALGKKGWKTRERLMVAINPAPSSQQLIRSARLLAFELDAPWIVVYVNNGKSLNTEDQTRLNKHLQLAHELGAEVITTNDLEIADGLQRVAKQKNITRLVIGRPSERSFFHRLFHESLVDRLTKENKQMDVLILRQDKLMNLYQQAIPTFQFTSPLLSYWIAFGAVLFVIFMGYFLVPWIGYKAVGNLFLVVILFLSLFVAQGPILLAAGLSALSWVFLFIPPVLSFAFKGPHDIALVLLYFFAALIVGLLNSRIREKDLFLNQREEKAEHLYEVMQEIAKSTNFQYLRLNVGAKLKALFGGDFDLLVKGSDNQLIFDSSLPILSEETDRTAALACFIEGKLTGWSTDTLPSAKGMYFPIKFSKIPIGILIFYSKIPASLSMEEMNFLQTVAEQLGIYLERYVFQERIQSQHYMRQVEKLHLAIFRSLSKGFYAPLEKIYSISQKFKQIAHNPEEEKLSQEMDQAGKNLKLIVDNILTISQLESGFIPFEKKQHAIKTLIEKTLQEVQPFVNDHPLHVELPKQDVVFPFDFDLLKIALKNVLINALEYSPTAQPIDVSVQVMEKEVKILVRDEGPGISPGILPFIFEKFYRVPGAKLEGVGLGLTIVKSIIDLHQGKLEVKNLEGKGTEFAVILPQ